MGGSLWAGAPEEEEGVEVAARVVHDLIDVEVAEEGAEEGDEGGDLVAIGLHHRPKLDATGDHGECRG